MADVHYIQQTLNEFFGTDNHELIVVPKTGKETSEDSLKPASDVLGSEVTFGPQGGEDNHETEAKH